MSGELHAFRRDAAESSRILQQRAEILAQPAVLSDLSSRDGRHIVCFRAGESTYAVELRQLREIRQCDRVAIVPNTPRSLLGLIQVHGDVTPVIDLIEFFGFRRAEPISRPFIVLVIQLDADSLGVVCDELLDVRPLRPGDVVSVPVVVNATEREVVSGVTSDRTLIIDGEVLLNHPRLSVGR